MSFNPKTLKTSNFIKIWYFEILYLRNFYINKEFNKQFQWMIYINKKKYFINMHMLDKILFFVANENSNQFDHFLWICINVIEIWSNNNI